MANRLMLRAIQLWLFIFLSWFVYCVNPVTQEDEDDVSREKLSIVVTQLKATPHLASLNQVETIITDNIDVNSLILSPSIAPATPWEDIKVSHSPFHAIHGEESARQASGGEPSQKEEIPSKILDGQIQSESKTEQFSKKPNLEKNEDSDEDTVDFQPNLGPNNEDTNSELSSVQIGNVNDGLSEKHSENKQGDISPTKDNMDNKKDITEHNLKPSEENNFDPGEIVAGDALDVGGEDTQVDEELVGARDDIESPREDMPSFKEWSKNFLAQEEQKNKVQQNIEKGNSETSTLKVRKIKSDRKQNNYASVDCGANILEKNTEAQNAESILLENKDFYMLNPCSANIWFIVELCDHVQVTSLQLANFELFSSTIEKFQVSFSTRYPTREWEQLQTFTARSEKAMQTFKLEPIFAKYMRVEQISYHGTEHYCPWSLLRVYGNSMVEAYEEHESSQEGVGSTVDDDDGTSSNVVEDKEVSSGILKTATDAVLNFVKETAKKLVKIEATGNSSNVSANSTNSTKYIGSPQQVTNSETPKTIVQLMDHEDFDTSCHKVTDEVLDGDGCLPGTFCSSLGSSASSYQIFFEIVHNICRQNFRNAKTCFSNLTKNIALNKSVVVPAFKSKSNSKDVVVDKEDTAKKNDSSGDENNSDKHTEVEITKNTDKMTAKQDHAVDTFPQSSSILRSSNAKISENTPVTPIILPSSSSSSSQSVTPDTVTPDTVTPDNMNHPSSPTPLAQPPLAVQQLPDTEEPPTESTVSNTKGDEENNENPVVTSNEVISDSSEAVTTMGSDVQLSATKHITPNQVTIATSSSETIASVSQDKLISSMTNDMTSVDDGEANQESHYQEESPGDEDEKLMLESITGTKEDQPNPHVDVLKITLTDAETKEGKAEPEHVTPNDLDKSESETLKDGNMNDRDIPTEPTNQVDSGSSGLKENSKTLDIDNGSESKENDVLENDMNEKSAGVTITSKKESESEHNGQHIITQKENEKIEGKEGNDITHEISSKIDEKTEITEQSEMSKDSETNSDKCDAEEYEVETYEEGTKHTRKNIQAALHSFGTAEPEPEPEPEPAILVGNGQMNNKKESIFVAMSRKIKALEQNVTMTNLFLEELSQRYRKSLDETQKKMEKKLSVMSKNSKFLTQVNLSQNTTIVALTSRLQNVEQELSEATSRLKVINQEVVERHVLGMCIQFVIVLLLWYFGRNRAPNTQNEENVDIKTDVFKDSIPTEGKVGNGHTKHSSVEDLPRDSMSNCFEEFTLSKSSNGETNGEVKRHHHRRPHRVSSVNSDQFLEYDTNQGQSIVTRTAGLLFHTPGCHVNVESVTKNATQRSCSADSLNGIAHTKDERKINTKKSAVSPCKTKKGFRNGGKKENGTTKMSSDLFNSDFSKSETTKNSTSQRELVRSKSDEVYGNRVDLYNNDVTQCNEREKPSPSRCSLHSDSCNQLNNQKNRWIWGFG